MSSSDRLLQSSPWSVLRRLYASRSLFVLVTMTAAGIFLILAPSLFKTSSNTQSILLALGTGLLASSLFSGVYVFYTNQEFIELLAEQMSDLQAAGMQQIVGYLSQANPTYLPLAVYEPTNNERSPFNRDLTASLRASRTYRFQGLTGYFVPIRLEATKTSLSLLKICLADTSENSALRLRVTREIALGVTRDYGSAVDQVKQKVTQCIVGLLEVRGRCQSIELSWISEASSDRYEIFDTETYITTFDSDAPITKYPKSVKFSQTSFVYDMVLRRFDLHFSGTNPRMVVIRPEDTNENVLQRLREAGLDIGESQYKECAQQFWQDVAKYSEQWKVK